MDQFPQKQWAKSVRRATTPIAEGAFGYGETSGSRALREQIAHHVRAAPEVECNPGQIVVTAGAQQAISPIAFALLEPGSVVWREDPGHFSARDTLSLLNARIYPAPLDREGIDFAQGASHCPHRDWSSQRLRTSIRWGQPCQRTGVWNSCDSRRFFPRSRGTSPSEPLLDPPSQAVHEGDLAPARRIAGPQLPMPESCCRERR